MQAGYVQVVDGDHIMTICAYDMIEKKRLNFIEVALENRNRGAGYLSDHEALNRL